MEEIDRLNRDFGVGAISFRDDLFTFKEDHTRELCDRIVSSGLNIPWKCQTRVDRVSAGLLRSMRRAGCTLVSFGVESGSETVLKKMRKGITKAQVERAFAWCREAGMPSIAYFMIGTPWETPETIDETISFAKRLPSTGSTFFLATPYPGTELEEEFRRAGWPIPDDLDVYVHARSLIHRADTRVGGVRRSQGLLSLPVPPRRAGGPFRPPEGPARLPPPPPCLSQETEPRRVSQQRGPGFAGSPGAAVGPATVITFRRRRGASPP
jgi:radical SAM superfamily enzyme YgiQ (UPF0313 family)